MVKATTSSFHRSANDIIHIPNVTVNLKIKLIKMAHIIPPITRPEILWSYVLKHSAGLIFTNPHMLHSIGHYVCPYIYSDFARGSATELSAAEFGIDTNQIVCIVPPLVLAFIHVTAKRWQLCAVHHTTGEILELSKPAGSKVDWGLRSKTRIEIIGTLAVIKCKKSVWLFDLDAFAIVAHRRYNECTITYSGHILQRFATGTHYELSTTQLVFAEHKNIRFPWPSGKECDWITAILTTEPQMYYPNNGGPVPMNYNGAMIYANHAGKVITLDSQFNKHGEKPINLLPHEYDTANFHAEFSGVDNKTINIVINDPVRLTQLYSFTIDVTTDADPVGRLIPTADGLYLEYIIDVSGRYGKRFYKINFPRLLTPQISYHP